MKILIVWNLPKKEVIINDLARFSNSMFYVTTGLIFSIEISIERFGSWTEKDIVHFDTYVGGFVVWKVLKNFNNWNRKFLVPTGLKYITKISINNSYLFREYTIEKSVILFPKSKYWYSEISENCFYSF